MTTYKTVQLHEKTWKALSILKIEMNVGTLQEVIENLMDRYVTEVKS